jgi:hypothetical protein
MEKIINRYTWNKVRAIELKDEMLFLRIFYSNNIPIKIKDNIIYCPYQYVEVARFIITAHYENNLSVEYYLKLDGNSEYDYDVSKNYKSSKRHLLKIIGPIILVMILLVFFKFLLLYNIL